MGSNTVNVIFGVHPFGLKEPYDALLDRGLVGRIKEIMDSGAFIGYANSGEAEIDCIFRRLKESGCNDVAIMGIWENACVMIGVKDALCAGLKVIVPKGYTSRYPLKDDGERNLLSESSSLEKDLRGCYHLDFCFSQDEANMYFSPKA